jgi:hypothetical protein
LPVQAYVNCMKTKKTTPKEKPVIARKERRKDIENSMDDTLDDSFPASDPPAWSGAAATTATPIDTDKVKKVRKKAS